MRTEPTKHPGIRKRISDDGVVSYQVRWIGRDRKRHSATRDTLRDAIELRSSMTLETRRGGAADPRKGRLPYREIYEEWAPTRHIRPSTRGSDAVYYRKHIEPHWGRRRLCDIAPSDIRLWIADLRDAELAPATIQKIYRLFGQPIRLAVAEGHILIDPTKTVKPPSIEKVEARFLVPDEVAALEAAMDEWWRPIVPFIAATGLRIGEVSALRVRHIDFIKGTVKVVATATVDETGKRIENAPKSAKGRRIVPTLSAEVAEILAAMVAKRGLGPDDYLFSGPRGGPMDTSNWRERYWHPAVKAAGLEEPLPTPHSLRHTAVSLWIATTGADAFKVMRWAGHASINTTFNLYGHLLPDEADDTRRILGQIRETAIETLAEKDNEITDLNRHRKKAADEDE